MFSYLRVIASIFLMLQCGHMDGFKTAYRNKETENALSNKNLILTYKIARGGILRKRK